MKTIGVDLQWELTRSLARLATCMRIERRDGNVYGFTTNTKALTIDGVLYEPAFSMIQTDIASGSQLEIDDVQIEGLLDSETITEDDLRAGRWDYFSFRMFQVCWADLTMGDKKDRAGHAGRVDVNRQTFVAELLGMMESYGTSIGFITQPACRNNLGDAKCGVDLNGSPSYTVTGVIDLCETDFFTLIDADRTEPDVYFDEGVITFLDGQAAGLSYEIRAYVVGVMVTKTAVAYDVTGASYSMHRGCTRSLAMCRDVYSNVINFNGEPWLRGVDALMQIGRGQ